MVFTTSKKRGEREVERGRAGARLTFLHCADARPAASSAAAGVRPSAYAFFPSVVKLLRQRLCDFLTSNTFPILLAFA